MSMMWRWISSKPKMSWSRSYLSASASGLRGSSFEEKQKKEKRQKYLKTYVEGCKRCKYWKEKLEKETFGQKKKNAMKHFEQAAAAAFRAEAHLSPKGKADWKAFQDEHGASAAERMADEWMKRHGSIFDEDSSFAFDDIDIIDIDIHGIKIHGRS